MTWFASSPNELEVSKEKYYPFNALDIDLPSGHLYFWTGLGDLVLNGTTYIGLAGMCAIDGEPENSELGVQRRTYSISGVDPALIDEDDIDNSFGHECIEYLGFFNPETLALIDTPEESFRGRIDSFSRQDGQAPIVKMIVEHRLAVIDRVDGWHYTHEDQQSFYPGDLGLNQVNNTVLKKALWGGGGSSQSVVGGLTFPARNYQR
jgi:hypothetical protein